MLHIHQVNLQPIVGGGEVYTLALTQALAEAGARVTLYVQPQVRLWDGARGERVEIVKTPNEAALLERLPRERCCIVTQGPLSPATAARMTAAHRVTGFAHMPMFQRGAEAFRDYRLVMTVSRYCLELLEASGVKHLYPEPVYGIAEVRRGTGRLVRRSPYIVDPRKVRDVLIGRLDSLVRRHRTPAAFARRPGLTLGLVSLIAPIKQFPRQFAILAPILARHPSVHLEVFGAGGYAQVRDLRRALAPLGRRARFWGYQSNVAAAYAQLDYLMTGLPEKEALGLNALEAQACGTPVLAPRARPFIETVQDGASGYLYRDPREDRGAAFAALLESILAGRPRPDPRIAAAEHLAKFSYPALFARARKLLDRLSQL